MGYLEHEGMGPHSQFKNSGSKKSTLTCIGFGARVLKYGAHRAFTIIHCRTCRLASSVKRVQQK